MFIPVVVHVSVTINKLFDVLGASLFGCDYILDIAMLVTSSEEPFAVLEVHKENVSLGSENFKMSSVFMLI